MILRWNQLCFASTIMVALVFLIKGQHRPKSVFNSGPNVGPALNKKRFPFDFYSGFPLPNGKQQKPRWGGTRSAPPQRGGAEGAALLFSVWQWKPGIKNLMEIIFLLRADPTFGTELKTDFRWRWPLIKHTRALHKKHTHMFFVRTDHYHA